MPEAPELEYALALSAWKQAGGTRWALRVNPSSGNPHPAEGQVLIGGIAELGEAPGLFHYAPVLTMQINVGTVIT